MTATRELNITREEIDGSVDISIELRNGNVVFFTDHKPDFKITIENNTNYLMKYSGNPAWVIAIGEGRPKPFIERRFSQDDIELKSGEKQTVTGIDEPLSIEGHGIIAIGGRCNLPTINHDEKYFELKASSTEPEDYQPLATFSVWDREHYQVVHEQPQKTQQFALFSSVAVVVLAVLQIFIAIQELEIGIIAVVFVITLYWHSGYLGNFLDVLRQN